jgi:peroxin-4
MFAQRLVSEVKKARNDSDQNFFIFPEGDNLQSWKAFLLGPADSPFEEGAFQLRVYISQVGRRLIAQDFPINPPKVFFVTKIYHPNIHWETGEVCLDILKTEWRATWTLHKLGKALSSLLFCPNADSPLNCDAGSLLSNPRKYDQSRRHTGL